MVNMQHNDGEDISSYL